ncbi:hypothetical protein I4F81_008643 [Pyropia yezoensis]|uniref:Uncharacterized protein n=1 Tax=Pyropia yezoensis TaxID=2788 RepID=A0ACC3C7S9_PYRYE|nr:hypothetical protein I4F81_008643 [Neopyropia yezoensis]
MPVGLRDAVASRVTVLLAPAASASAATTAPLRPPAAAVAAVRADLRCTRSSSLLAAALLCGVHARVASRAPRLLAAVVLNVPADRNAAVMRRWPGGVAGGGVGIGRDDALLSDWAWLLASDLHMGATPADAPCCAAAAPDAGAVRRSLGCMAAAAAAASSTAAAADAHAAAARALTADALAVTLALYEEAKLTRAAEPDLPVLGSLAAALAARLGADAYVRYYVADGV